MGVLRGLLLAGLLVTLGVSGASACPYSHPVVPHSVAIAEVTPSHAAGRLGLVSCPSAGNCEAVGSSGSSRLSSVQEVSGRWRWASAARAGSAANAPQVSMLTCPALGNCVAIGSYKSASGRVAPGIVEEVSGHWGSGTSVTLPADAASPADASLSSVSCAQAGDCVAVGSYLDTSGSAQPLLVEQVSGRWSAGVDPGHPGGAVQGSLSSVFCGSPGNCVAFGSYAAGYPWLLKEVAGTWTVHHPQPPKLPDGAPATNAAAFSCSSLTRCTGIGLYTSAASVGRPFALTYASGSWTAAFVPLPANGSTKPASLQTVACSSAGNCSAVGAYTPVDDGRPAVFFVDEISGRWQRAVEARAPTDGRDYQRFDRIGSIVCQSAGNCTVYGNYEVHSHEAGWIASEISGQWSKAITASLPLDANPSSQLYSMSCGSAGNCVALGDAQTGIPTHGRVRAFVLAISRSRRPPAPTCAVTGSALVFSGVLRLTVRCNQNAAYRLVGEVATKRGEASTAAQVGHAAKGAFRTLTARVPASVVAALKKHETVSASFQLNAGNANGSRFAYLEVNNLHY
jgi:hypothetical protein